MSDINFLDKLKKVAESSLVESELMTSNDKVSLKPLNVKQQKDILKTALDNILSPITLSLVFNDIIKTNITQPRALYTSDKNLILINLRKNSIGNLLKVKTENDQLVEIDLQEHFKKINLEKIDVKIFERSLNEGNISLVSKVPTLEDDTKINLELKKLSDKINNDEKLREIIGELFIVELVKFIKEIQFSVDGKVEKLDFNTLTLEQKLKAFETIPMSLTYKLIDTVTELRKLENNLLSLNYLNIPQTIILDSTFFFKE